MMKLSKYINTKWFLICFSIILILGIVFGLVYNGLIWFVYPDRSKYPVLGIDVSHYQGIIDWKKVKNAGIGFLYVKATEGDDWVDKKFFENYIQATEQKIKVGAYHFYSLRISGEKQLANIVGTLSGTMLDLPIGIDLEFVGNSKVRPSKSEFQNELDFLLIGVEKFQGTRPILYTTYDFYEQYLGEKYLSYPIWIRDIFSFPESIDWAIWQYKDRGYIQGINTFVDLNVLSGSLEDILIR